MLILFVLLPHNDVLAHLPPLVVEEEEDGDEDDNDNNDDDDHSLGISYMRQFDRSNKLHHVSLSLTVAIKALRLISD